MADEVKAGWESEPIPDEDDLYMRVHKDKLDDQGHPFPGAFQNKPTPNDGMSTDWAKYSTPRETRLRARTPKDNAVVRMNVGRVRAIPEQSVEHTPDPATANRAHTDVWGDKKKNPR